VFTTKAPLEDPQLNVTGPDSAGARALLLPGEGSVGTGGQTDAA
jgi:hypothetical protein